MTSLNIADLLKLSVPVRIQLVEDIWDSIAASPDGLPIPDSQRQELHRRMADHEDHPDEGRAWGEIRDSLREKR